MGKEITVIKAEAIPSLPPSLAALAVGTVQWPGQKTRLHIQTREGTLTEAERTEAEAILSTLTIALSGNAPFEVGGEVYPGKEAKGVLLLKLLDGLAGRQRSESEGIAKAEMYHDAIDDLPAWAIDKAVKRWARGECPYSVEEKPKYDFPPSPATLRKMALFDMDTAKRDAAKARALLDCIPLERAMDPKPIPEVRGLLPALQRMR